MSTPTPTRAPWGTRARFAAPTWPVAIGVAVLGGAVALLLAVVTGALAR